MNQVTITPDLLYQVVSSNPNLKDLVNRTVNYMQTQQQLAPQLQQMMQNPVAAINNYVQWQHEQQAQPQQQTLQQTQGGNQQMGMYEQAMGIVEEFRKYFATMNDNFIILNNNLKEMNSDINKLKEEINELKETKVENVSKTKLKE